MKGKTITKSIELENGFMLIKLDDGKIHLFHRTIREDIQEPLLELMEGKSETVSTPEEEEETTDDPNDPDDAYTWKDLEEMSYKELKTLCKENELDTDPKDYERDEVDDFRREVAKEIEIKIPDDGGKGDDKYTWEELKEMDFEELEDLIDEEKLDTDPDDYDEKDGEENKLRKAIAKELGITPPKPDKK